MGDGVGQGADHLQELDDRTRPTVGENQGQGAVVGGRHMDEVDAEAVDVGRVLGEFVQARFARRPVVAVGPVRAQRPDVFERRALRPVAHRLGLRPAGAGQPGPQIGKIRLGHGDLERDDLVGHATPSFPS